MTPRAVAICGVKSAVITLSCSYIVDLQGGKVTRMCVRILFFILFFFSAGGEQLQFGICILYHVQVVYNSFGQKKTMGVCYNNNNNNKRLAAASVIIAIKYAVGLV